VEGKGLETWKDPGQVKMEARPTQFQHRRIRPGEGGGEGESRCEINRRVNVSFQPFKKNEELTSQIRKKLGLAEKRRDGGDRGGRKPST